MDATERLRHRRAATVRVITVGGQISGDRAHGAVFLNCLQAVEGKRASRPSVTVVVYMVLTPDGALAVRKAPGEVGVDEWGTPYQHRLWAAVRGDVDPHRDAVNGVPLDGDLRAKVADAAKQLPEVYPPNPVASTVLTSLGCPPRARAGTIAIVGAEDDDGITASLTADQLDAVATAHRLARAAL
jgi:hypothetical protein